MRFRKLRIAWSVGCGVLCLLLVVLWMKSNSWVTNIQPPLVASRTFQCAFMQSGILLCSRRLATQADRDDWLAIVLHYHKSNPEFKFWNDHPYPQFKFSIGDFIPGQILVHVPYWFPVLITGLAAALPWSTRFSLRTLFIGMTVVTVGLGLIVYAARK